MIELCIFKSKLRVDFTFFAAILLFLLIDKSGYGILGLYACIIHELGHLLMMVVVGCRPDIITLYGAGMKIQSYEQYKLSTPAEIAVILSGSATNFICFAIFIIAFPVDLRLQVFAVTHLVIGAFNLLPIMGFDGERLLSFLLNNLVGPAHTLKIVQIISFIVSTVLAIAAIFSFGDGAVNFTIIITLFYFIISSALMRRH